MRVTLLAIVFSNVVNFMVSAQAYSDAVLILDTAFFVGCFLGTARLPELYKARSSEAPVAVPNAPRPLAGPATV